MNEGSSEISPTIEEKTTVTVKAKKKVQKYSETLLNYDDYDRSNPPIPNYDYGNNFGNMGYYGLPYQQFQPYPTMIPPNGMPFVPPGLGHGQHFQGGFQPNSQDAGYTGDFPSLDANAGPKKKK